MPAQIFPVRPEEPYEDIRSSFSQIEVMQNRVHRKVPIDVYSLNVTRVMCLVVSPSCPHRSKGDNPHRETCIEPRHHLIVPREIVWRNCDSPRGSICVCVCVCFVVMYELSVVVVNGEKK